MSSLSAPYLHDEEAAHEFVESVLWPNGACCPRCAKGDRITKVKANKEKRIRVGLYRCGHCKRQFTVKVGTIFEDSNVKMHLWLQAIVLMTASKKGISAHQLHRTLGVTYKTAWFMEHRIREAMRSGNLATFGNGGNIVEIDETYIGVKDEARARRLKAKKKGKKLTFRGGAHKMAVLTLVNRKGEARSFHIDEATKKTVLPIIRDNLDAEARVVTDDAGFYHDLDEEYMHAFVRHSHGEYGRGEIHTNTIEGYFSIFKRGMKGAYQHCKEKHLHRYLAEFDFRYSNRSALGIDDHQRARKALEGATGKRLKYQGSNQKVV